jgi:hypothetical protein
MTAVDAMQGALTEAEAVVGDITLGGTAGLALDARAVAGIFRAVG